MKHPIHNCICGNQRPKIPAVAAPPPQRLLRGAWRLRSSPPARHSALWGPDAVRVRGVTYPKVYELTPPHGTPLTPRSQELTPNRNHHGTPALTDRFFDWFLTFLRDLVHFASICGCFTFDPNVKVRMAYLEIVFLQPKLSDVFPIVGTPFLIFKNIMHDVFPIGIPIYPSTRETAYPTTHKTCAIGKSARHTDTYPYICNLFHEIPFQSSTFSILS